MKKLMIAAVVLIIALPLFADEETEAKALDNASISISGDATAKWGIDLDSMATGFTNTLNAKLRVNFGLAGTAKTTGGEEDTVYGEIYFDEIEVRTQQTNNGNPKDAVWEMDIDLQHAKIVTPMFWISIKGADDSIDYENALQNGIIGIAASWDSQMDHAVECNNDCGSNGGIEAGLTLEDLLAAELSFFSITDWTSATDMNAYGLKTSVALKAVENLTLEAAFNMAFGLDAGSSNIGVGAKAAYKIMLGDTMYIQPEVAMDMVALAGGAGMNIAIGNGLRFSLGGSEIKDAEDAIQDDDGTLGASGKLAWDDGVNDGLTLGWDLFLPATGNTELGLQAHFGLSLIENLQVAVGFEAADVMNNGDMGFAVWGDYDAGVVVPYAGLFMRFDNEPNGGSDGVMVANAGLAVPDFIPNTSLYVDYRSGNLTADDVGDVVDPGIATVAVTIKY